MPVLLCPRSRPSGTTSGQALRWLGRESLRILAPLLLLSGWPQVTPAAAAPGPAGPAAAMEQGRWREGRTLTVTARENGQTLVMRSGETLRVVLSASAGTGYSWDLERFERNVIEPLGGEIRQAPGQPLADGTALPLAGGPQQITVLFRVLRPGRSAVSLKLWRGWEGEGSIVERFRVVVVAVKT